MNRYFLRIVSLALCLPLILQQPGFAQAAGVLEGACGLRHPFIQDKFRPPHFRYIAYDRGSGDLKIILDKGDSKALPAKGEIERAARILLDYFYIGLTLPNDKFWVNLRPDSPGAIIDDSLARTDVGKILLEADVQLKKDTAAYTSPGTPEGKDYWNKIRRKAGEIFGSENTGISTLARPWIVPDEVIIAESGDDAYIYKASLKVMLEQDYLRDSPSYNFTDDRLKRLNEYSSRLIREIIIPRLNKEINSSRRYAALRQVYYSLILSQWFKKRFANGNSACSGLIDRENLAHLTSARPWSSAAYFQAYQKSFTDGEYTIKERSSYGRDIRSYSSGGINVMDIVRETTVLKQLSPWPEPAHNTYPLSARGLPGNLSLMPAGEVKINDGGENPLPAVDEEFLTGQWRKLCALLNASGDGDALSGIMRKYSEGGRVYHNLLHLEHMLKEFEVVEKLSVDPAALLCAIWLHDVVYDPARDDNEEKSAEFAREILSGMGQPREFIRAVERLIALTKTHDPANNDIDGQILADLDLAILGSSDDIYDIYDYYDRGIRKEYSFVEINAYLEGRRQVVRRFLDKAEAGQLYHLPLFRQRFGSKAVSNLGKSLSWLESAQALFKGLVFPEGRDRFDPYVFLDHDTAVYAGEFDDFGDTERDVIQNALQVYKKLFVLVLSRDADQATLQKRVNTVHSMTRDKSDVIVCGNHSVHTTRALARLVRSKTLIRKMRSIPGPGKLDYEAALAKRNYNEFGLETIFIVPSNEHLALTAQQLEKYSNMLKLALAKEFPGEDIEKDFIHYMDRYNKQRTGVLAAKPLNKRVAFYAGSFDPVTNGHMHVIERAATVYDKVYVGIGSNPSKTPMFAVEERMRLIRTALNSYGLDNVEVVSYEGLTVDKAVEVGAGSLIRGARSVKDLRDELPLAWANVLLRPGIGTTLMVPYESVDVSSTLVRNSMAEGKDISGLVPGSVYWAVHKEEIDRLKKGKKIIGLVGGIASGKSTVSRYLARNKEIFVLDLDVMSHELYDDENVRRGLVEAFGEHILTGGRIDRAKLSPEVFKNNQKLTMIKKIMYPVLYARLDNRIKDILRNQQETRMIVIEGIGFVDAGLDRIADELWYVDAPEQDRIRRIIDRRSRTHAYARSVIHAQQDMLERAKARSSFIIDNSGAEEELYKQVAARLRKETVMEKSTGTPVVRDGGKGGVDFRIIPVASQPASVIKQLIAASSDVYIDDLDKEWSLLAKMAGKEMVPSFLRIKEFAIASYALGEFGTYDKRILSCIAEILRKEEEQNLRTDPGLGILLNLAAGARECLTDYPY